MGDVNGWIKIHRRIKNHWVHKNPYYFKAWIDILMEVNHQDKKILIDNELLGCNRGQSLHSLDSWRKIFGKNWSIQKVRTFFKLLQKDSMIGTEGLRKTTRLTVCNYDTYQDTQQTDNKQITNRQHSDNIQITTNKNVKKEKNVKNKNRPDSAKEVSEYASKLVMATDPTGPLASDSAKQLLRYGGSVRAVQSIILASKVRALLKGRLNVSFEDINDVSHPALRHRIIRNFECEAEGINPDAGIRHPSKNSRAKTCTPTFLTPSICLQ